MLYSPLYTHNSHKCLDFCLRNLWHVIFIIQGHLCRDSIKHHELQPLHEQQQQDLQQPQQQQQQSRKGVKKLCYTSDGNKESGFFEYPEK